MAMKPNNVNARADLTQYAFALMQDLDPIRRVASLLSPVVPTGGKTGQYNKFDSTQAFKNYASAVARRAIGGHANTIGFLSDVATYTVQDYGLRISIDNAERANAGGMSGLLEQAKTRTLTVNCMLSYLADVIATVKSSVAATANVGTWLSADVDPIKEINAQIKAIFKASGMIPNTILFDFGAWCVFADNPAVLKRMPGADLAQVTPERVSKLFVNPNMRLEIVETSVLSGGGLGNAAATKAGILGGSVLIFFNSPVATPYDPSFCKTFAPSANLFTEVYSYPEAPHLDWYENDWACQPVVVSSALCKRIDVTGAND